MRRLLPFLMLAALLAGMAFSGTASAATRCPATFQVLHNDRIGAMSLPAGPYYVYVTRLSCPQASDLFADFLQDYDGVLPYPWRANNAKRIFTTGRQSFRVVPVSSPTPPNPPTPPPSPYVCPGTFSVLHNDRIGALRFPRGRYTMTILTTNTLNCSQAAADFARFLWYPSGKLPSPWKIVKTESPNPSAFFNNVPGDRSFRVDRVGGSVSGGGNSGAYSCGPFRVLHNDHIGSLHVPRGPHDILLPEGSTMSCAAASKQFLRFLNAEALPRTWALDPVTATFTLRRDPRVSFRIGPVSGSVL